MHNITGFVCDRKIPYVRARVDRHYSTKGIYKYLKKLSITKNNLTSLPEGIFSGLTSLTNLELGENRYTTLPQGIFSGLTLNYLWIRNNPLDAQTRQYLQSLNIPDLHL